MSQAKAAESSKEIDKAIELWKLAANETDKPGQESKYAYALVHLGDQYRLKKETAQAIAAYKKALDVEPNFAWIKYQLLPKAEEKLASSN